MTDKTDDTLAKTLYDHYCHARGGRDDEGLRMPCWVALTETERGVWRRFCALSHWTAVRHHEAQKIVTCTGHGCAPDGTIHGGSCPLPSMPPLSVPRRHVPPRREGLGEVTVTVRVEAGGSKSWGARR